jgi:hypothetical protein
VDAHLEHFALLTNVTPLLNLQNLSNVQVLLTVFSLKIKFNILKILEAASPKLKQNLMYIYIYIYIYILSSEICHFVIKGISHGP